MFTIYSDSGSDSTMVSNLFIDEYMERANDAQIKIYLYLLRVVGSHRTTSVSDLADRFNHTEKDVVRSLRYWERQGLLNLRFDSENDLVSVCMRRPSSPAKNQSASGESGQANKVLSFSPAAENSLQDISGESARLLMAAGGGVPSQGLPAQAGPAAPSGSTSEDRRYLSCMIAPGESLPADGSQYTGGAVVSGQSGQSGQSGLTGLTADSGGINPAPSTDQDFPGNRVSSASCRTGIPSSTVSSASSKPGDVEALERFRSDAGRAQLLFVIEQYIGKPLSVNEIGIIYHISEKLHFSDDMIDYLLQYCVDRGKKDFRYIAKVAENWAKDGIMTPAQAEIYSAGSAEAGGFGKYPASGRDAAGRSGKRADSSTRKTGKKGGHSRSSNVFNQFEQNSYDFDALEEELLSTPDSGPGPQ